MSDIVGRLRKRKSAKGFEYSVDPVDGHNVLDTVYVPDPDCIEAADEIERLRAALSDIADWDAVEDRHMSTHLLDYFIFVAKEGLGLHHEAAALEDKE